MTKRTHRCVACGWSLVDELKSILADRGPSRVCDLAGVFREKGVFLTTEQPDVTISLSMARHPEVFEKIGGRWQVKS